jgi:hypothetical protein
MAEMDFAPSMTSGPVTPPEPPQIRPAGGMNLVDLPSGLSMPSSLTGGIPQSYIAATAQGGHINLPKPTNPISVSGTNSPSLSHSWPHNVHETMARFNEDRPVTEDNPRQYPLREEMKRATSSPQHKRGNLGHVVRGLYKMDEIRLNEKFSLVSNPREGVSASINTGNNTKWHFKAKPNAASFTFEKRF